MSHLISAMFFITIVDKIDIIISRETDDDSLQFI